MHCIYDTSVLIGFQPPILCAKNTHSLIMMLPSSHYFVWTDLDWWKKRKYSKRSCMLYIVCVCGTWRATLRLQFIKLTLVLSTCMYTWLHYNLTAEQVKYILIWKGFIFLHLLKFTNFNASSMFYGKLLCVCMFMYGQCECIFSNHYAGYLYASETMLCIVFPCRWKQ